MQEEDIQLQQQALERYIYLDRDSIFGKPHGVRWLGSEDVILLSHLQRAVGSIAGMVKDFEQETGEGKVVLQGYELPFKDVRPVEERTGEFDLANFKEREGRFSFWPTIDSLPAKIKKPLPLSHLKISRVCYSDRISIGEVEVIGKVERIFDGGFVVSIASLRMQTFFYVVFASYFECPQEVGTYVWATGELVPDKLIVRLQETSALEFVPEDQLAKIGTGM